MDDIRKAILGARAQQVGRIYGSITNASEVTAPEGEIRKGEDSEEEEEKTEESTEKAEETEAAKEEESSEKEEDTAEKSHIMDAISYSGVKISKTGKEIKDQATNVLLPRLNAELEDYKKKADEKLALCGKAPTEDPKPWWTDDIELEVPYKVYNWNETYVPKPSVAYDTLSAEDAAAKRGNVPENDEQAKAREEYNEAVRMVCNTMVDIKACELMQNLKDKTSYELSPRQVLTLGF